MKPSEKAEFEAFVAARSDALVRTAFLMCGDWHQAQDVLQIALTKLYVAWRRIERRDGVEAYARRILVRCLIDESRRGWRRERPTDTLPDRAAPDRPSDDRQVVLASLALLPNDQRVVLVLRYWEDLSIADTARLLDLSTGTVKSRAFRGLAALRAHLASHQLELTETLEESSDA
jgi:RNA polymerase sigma-70 factor (sigma-E family)